MESTLKLDPKHADALNYLGYTYADRDMKISEAVELTQRAVSLKPDNGYYVDSLAWALFKMGRLDAARAEIIKAATLVKDDPVIYEHLGEINMKQNLRHEAKEARRHRWSLIHPTSNSSSAIRTAVLVTLPWKNAYETPSDGCRKILLHRN